MLFDEIEVGLAALPGVSATASALVPLLADSNSGVGINVEGYEAAPGSERTVLFNMVGTGFFGAVGVPLMRGRDFSIADTTDSPPVAIINERFAERYGLGNAAIGTRIKLGFFDERDVEIVGVVRDSKYSTVKDPVPAQLFLSRHQAPFPVNDLSFYVSGRAGFESAQLLGAIRQAVASVDPTLPVTDLRTVDQQVRLNVAEDRLLTLLTSALATMATVLAALGLYGVLSFTVAQRTREIGLRLALGAGRPQLRRLIFGQVFWMGVVGGLTGIVVAAALGRGAAGLLFGLSATYAPAYFIATAVLAAILGAAAYLPARRASRIDPMVALRSE
jgi:predicted permease